MKTVTIKNDALVVLVGPAGAGKSTFAARHFEPHQIVSSDYCRYLVCGDPTRQDVSQSAFAVFHEIIKGKMRHGELAVADATNLKTFSRRNLEIIATNNGRPVVYICIDVPLETVLAQNANRERVVPEDVVRKHYAEYVKVRDFLSFPIIVTQNEKYEIELV